MPDPNLNTNLNPPFPGDSGTKDPNQSTTTPSQEDSSFLTSNPSSEDTNNPSTTEQKPNENPSTPPSESPPPESIITAPHTPQKYGGKKVIATIFGILFLIGGITAGVLLVQRQQRLAEQAKEVKQCGECEGKVTELTLRYIGTISNALVEVFQKKNNEKVFSGYVNPNEEFTFNMAKSTLKFIRVVPNQFTRDLLKEVLK